MYVCGSRTVLSSIAILGDLGDGFCHARLKQLLEMTLIAGCGKRRPDSYIGNKKVLKFKC